MDHRWIGQCHQPIPQSVKKHVQLSFGILSLLLLLAVLGLLCVPAMWESFHWAVPLQIFLILALTISIGGILLSVTDHTKKCLPRKGWKWILVFFLLFPMAFHAIHWTSPYIWTDDSSPLVIPTDTRGTYGIPDHVIYWRTRTPTIERVQWGTVWSNTTMTESIANHNHRFMLTDLYPNTTYWYQISNTPIRFITTPVLAELRFAISSDLHIGSTLPSSVNDGLSTIAHLPFTSAFFLGDIVKNGFQDHSWITATSAMSTLPFPVCHTVGNHDIHVVGNSKYLAYTSPDMYYEIDYGNCHLFKLDLITPFSVFSPAQQAWLDHRMTEIPSTEWIIFLAHSTFFTANDYSWVELNAQNRTGLLYHSLFQQWGVDLVLSGHCHYMSLLNKTGVTYATVGTLNDHSVVTPPPCSEMLYLNHTAGFVDLTVTSTEVGITFRSIKGNTLFSSSIFA